jgi:EAL domain-containing protein (putative c-di-GMP-specific phosphodiesterase class I)
MKGAILDADHPAKGVNFARRSTLEKAPQDRMAWAAAGLDLDVAVNLSVLLPSDPAFVRRLETVLKRYADGVPHLTLDVTESAGHDRSGASHCSP